jgi:integrase
MARRTKRADGLMQKKFRVNIKGVSKQFVVYGHNEKELTEKEQAKRAEIENGIVKYDNPSVEEFYLRWIEGRRGTITECTLRAQEKTFCVIKKIAIPQLSNVCFGDIKIRDVDIEILRIVQRELKKDRKSQTVNDYMALIKHIFSDAQKERVIDYNPCVLLNKLKRSEERARDTHHRALSIDEQKAFFECERCKSSYYYNVFRFAINTGMRIGEIGALRYTDIRNNTIHVERTITRTEAGSYIVGEDAKTEAGRRSIPMNEQIKSIITEQKEINQVLEGGVISLNDYLFKAVERGLLLATPIDREIKRICKAAGIEPFTMHALRATFATRAIESGMNPKTLQEIMGHSNFNITMSLYGHCLADTKQQEMAAVVIAI